MSEFSYDLLVLGSGPAGQRAAIQGVKLNKRVALIERKAVVGGTCINTGTIPSKTLREAVLHLSGYRLRGLYGASYTVKQNITMQDLLFRTEHVIRHEIDVNQSQLMRNQVEVFTGEAAFVDPHTVRVTDVDERGNGRGPRGSREVTAAHVVIATGTEATRDTHRPSWARASLESSTPACSPRLACA
jgi:NAD(P) transhydrogenase